MEKKKKNTVTVKKGYQFREMPQIENENDPKAGGLRDEQILAIDIVIMSTLSMLGSLFMILASLRTMFGKRLRNKWLQWSTVLTSNRHSSAEGIEEEDHTLSDSGRSRYHGSGPTRASNNRMVLSLALINLFMSGMYIYSQILYIWLPDGGYIEGDTTSVAICTSQAYLVLSAQWVHMTWQLLFGFNFALRVNTPYLGIRAAKFILQHYVALEIIYHVIAWGVSLSISTILLLTDGLGRTFFGCWIKKGLFAQFFLYYIPQFVFYGLIFIFYLVTVVVVKHLQTKSRLMSWLPSRIVKEKSSSARNILSVKRILRQNRAIFKLNAHLLMYILATAPTLIISIINFIIPDFVRPSC